MSRPGFPLSQINGEQALNVMVPADIQSSKVSVTAGDTSIKQTDFNGSDSFYTLSIYAKYPIWWAFSAADLSSTSNKGCHPFEGGGRLNTSRSRPFTQIYFKFQSAPPANTRVDVTVG